MKHEAHERRVVAHVKKFRKKQPRSGLKKLRVDINIQLRKDGDKEIGRDRLFSIARENGLLLERRKSRQPVTTYSGHQYVVQPNRIKAITPSAPGQVVVADITYLTLRGGTQAYLFAVTDKYSRCIVGHFLSKSLNHEGAIKALEMANKNLPLNAKTIHHTDRGVQYCCHEFLDRLAKLGICQQHDRFRSLCTERAGRASERDFEERILPRPYFQHFYCSAASGEQCNLYLQHTQAPLEFKTSDTRRSAFRKPAHRCIITPISAPPYG